MSIPKNQVRTRNSIEQHEHCDDANARRIKHVDENGNPINVENPLPVRLSDGSVYIGSVNAELEVQLSHKDNDPDSGDVADSVQIGDGNQTVKVHPTNRSISANTYEKLIPLLTNSNWMKLGDFDQVSPIFSGTLATLEYLQNNAIIGRAFYNFTDDLNWTMSTERYINDADGDILLNDNDTPLFLD